MKLTAAQKRALVAADRSGGVLGFGQHYRTVEILRTSGLLSDRKDKLGYYTITEAGRQALKGGSE
nr:hypothetical protein [Brucella intermedia]